MIYFCRKLGERMKRRKKINKLSIEPWGLSLSERLGVFERAKKDGKKVALYFVKAPDSSTFRYRCFNTFQATLKSKKWQAVFFFKNETKVVKNLIPDANLVILGRQSRWNECIEKILKIARDSGLKVLFDLDDLVFDKKYLSIVMNTIGESKNLSYWVPYFDDIHATGEKVDGFLVTNDFLGEKIKQTFEKPYKVIVNSLNEEQLAASYAYLTLGEKEKEKKFDIGYFSGSPTHVNDLEVALPEIFTFLEKHSDARLVVVGLMEFDKRAKKFLKNGQVKIVSPVDFRKLQKLMCEVKVNIAPLVANDFTNCKSELKFFEAAIVETTTIASPTYTFKNAIKDGENGLLAQPGEWYDKLEYLYNNPEKNKKIAECAKKYALKHYYGREFLKEVEKAYDYFAK